MYEWVCRGCGKKLDVLRSFDDYRVPPTTDEVPEKCSDKREHEWDKKIHSPHVTKGPGWRTSKGNH